jgi:hypothetical protein
MRDLLELLLRLLLLGLELLLLLLLLDLPRKGKSNPMARGRSTKWIRTSRLSTKNSLSGRGNLLELLLRLLLLVLELLLLLQLLLELLLLLLGGLLFRLSDPGFAV